MFCGVMFNWIPPFGGMTKRGCRKFY